MSWKLSKWDELPWKPVDTSAHDFGEFQDAVFLGLEEIDTSEFLNSSSLAIDDSAVSSIVCDDKAKVKKRARNAIQDDADSVSASKLTKKKKKSKKISSENLETENIGVRNKPLKREILENSTSGSTKILTFADGHWGEGRKITIHSLLVDSMKDMKFFEPTDIQSRCIPLILKKDCDLVGAAETGSGKTFAFGLPILHTILRDTERDMNRSRQCPTGLILAPTRELAMQIAAVLRSVCNLPHIQNHIKINVVTVVGGMSEHKQKRQLNDPKRQLHILIATPGRLAELIEEENLLYLRNLSSLSYLVVDEADRMLEEGHFPELLKIFETVKSHEELVRKGLDPLEEKQRKLRGIDEPEEDEDRGEGDGTGEEVMGFTDGEGLYSTMPSDASSSCPVEILEGQQEQSSTIPTSAPSSSPSLRQTLLFSATATNVAAQDLSRGGKKRRGKKRGRSGDGGQGHLQVDGRLQSLVPCLQQLLTSVAVQKVLHVVDVSVSQSALVLEDGKEVKNSSGGSQSHSQSQSPRKPDGGEGIAADGKGTAANAGTSSLPAGLSQYEVKVPGEEKDVLAYYFLLQVGGGLLNIC